jgi:hypothetical protein
MPVQEFSHAVSRPAATGQLPVKLREAAGGVAGEGVVDARGTPEAGLLEQLAKIFSPGAHEANRLKSTVYIYSTFYGAATSGHLTLINMDGRDLR